jgi:hypothetical protein
VSKIIIEIIVLLALPLVSIIGGGWIMTVMSKRQPLIQKPLGQRIGYNISDVQQCWGVLDCKAILSEKRFLELDLVFPFVYGGAFTISLLIAWTSLNRPISPLWIMTPLAITILADWMENLAQLGQIKRYIINREIGLQSNWIRVASVATTVKWIFFGVVSMFLFTLVGMIFVRAFKPS